ncbi:MAG: hypothetical protein JNK65_02645, partial [Deltaproteobacteria bacterium]|nr:hypothetical protein [Deltaproteobacteria bacterium]
FGMKLKNQTTFSDLKKTFLEDEKRESTKKIQQRIQEKFVSEPFAFSKGVAQGTLKLLEQGVNIPQKAYEAANAWMTNPYREIEKSEEVGRKSRSFFQNAFSNPGQTLKSLYHSGKNLFLEKTNTYLKIGVEDRAEQIGKSAPNIAFGILTNLARMPVTLTGMAERLRNKVLSRGYPLGFNNRKEFVELGKRIENEILKNHEATLYVRGSSVEGLDFKKNYLFDKGHKGTSDIDVSIVSESLLKELNEKAVDTFGKGTRTVPFGISKRILLKNSKIAGYEIFLRNLYKEYKREITLMVYKNHEALSNRQGNFIPIPRK